MATEKEKTVGENSADRLFYAICTKLLIWANCTENLIWANLLTAQNFSHQYHFRGVRRMIVQCAKFAHTHQSREKPRFRTKTENAKLHGKIRCV